jgi:hypothetical protein
MKSHFHESPWSTQNNTPNAMTSPSLSNSTKVTKAIGEIREEE